MRTDKQRLDWLEKRGFGMALISDDNGHWAMATSGFQNVAFGKKPVDVATTFFIEKKYWARSVRKAIDIIMDEEQGCRNKMPKGKSEAINKKVK